MSNGEDDKKMAHGRGDKKAADRKVTDIVERWQDSQRDGGRRIVRGSDSIRRESDRKMSEGNVTERKQQDNG